MTTLYIDDLPADTDESTAISISLSIASITSIEKGKTGYSKSITIPATARNRKIMGDCEQINNRNMFNSASHTAKIVCDGFTVMDGIILLTECDITEIGHYKFNILGGSKNWANHAALFKISSLELDYSATIGDTMIMNSWTDENCYVRFLPVQRERYRLTNSSVSLMPATRVLSSSDYHPFLHLKTLIQRIFNEAEYEIVSDFFDSDDFNSLYISGRYPTRDVAALKKSMDFNAGRFENSTAYANESGYVFANPLSNYNTIGNIVETADPEEERDGMTVNGVYNNGGCFTYYGRRIAFIPTEEVSVSFDYHFKYITDYKIASRTELCGFNTISLPYNDIRRYKIVNSFIDVKDSFAPNMSYRVVVFDHTEGTHYRLIIDEVTNESADMEYLTSNDVTTQNIADFTTRSTLVSFITDNRVTNLKLLFFSDNTYIEYQGDWAVYEGYIGETGEKEIEVKLRGKCEKILPSSPKLFNTLWFGGATQGMRFTIEPGSTISPVFNPHPTEGSTIDFSQVACYNISRIALVNAVKNIFNLYFYTDNLNKRVYVEPRKNFFSNDTIIDWSDRIDYSMPIQTQEFGDDMSKNITFRYLPTDKAVSKWNYERNDDFGAHTEHLNNVFANENDTIYENPLFAPSLNTDVCLPNAQSARLIQVGDTTANNDTDDFNFTPKIVRYKGMVALEDGELWSYPSYGTQYPYAAFHCHDDKYCNPFTLCFEDRNGIEGMHNYWDGNFRYYNHSKRVILYLRLHPEEIEALLVPNGRKHDFRAKFALTIGGETSHFRLEEICNYNPMAISTKCILIKIV